MTVTMSAHLPQSQSKWESTALGFLHRQLFEHPKPIPENTDLTGQTAIITGANTGLGLESARQLLRLGLERVILAVRSQERGDAAAGSLRNEFPDALVDVWLLDMASYDSVTTFSQRCDRELERIDMVILNAGLQMQEFSIVEATGHETGFQVNYLSTALLAILMLPILKSKKHQADNSEDVTGRPTPRLLIVASDMAWLSTFNTKPSQLIATRPQVKSGLSACFDDPSKFHWWGQYADTKLLQVMLVARLAGGVGTDGDGDDKGFVKPRDVIVSAVNPGFTDGTEFNRHTLAAIPFAHYAMALCSVLLTRSLAVGASTYVDAIVGDRTAEEAHGAFLSDWAVKA